MKQTLKQLDFQPNNLTQEEMLNPEIVLANFFDNFPIHECRSKTWELYKGWTSYAVENADATQAVDMLLFYDQLIEFMNASFVYIAQEKIEENLPN
ncbi:hypothetical protein [Pedobacter gandavensis]|uniref:hypothetical protein n=1 Tax=Pedobacter gandavensis TaxID=2679963 RepID=UPI00293159A4|nr:hypothetical protein [Pedobacter gandavensis]